MIITLTVADIFFFPPAIYEILGFGSILKEQCPVNKYFKFLFRR